jgi:hypothetical protein
VSNRSLFCFEFPLHRCAAPPAIDGSPDAFGEDWLLPPLMELDGQEPFGQVYAAWGPEGLYIGCRVGGKREPLRCDPRYFWKGDNLRLCTDMRGTRTIKRATRFCQQFFFLPAGGGRGGQQAVAGTAKIHRAREDAPAVDDSLIACVSRVGRNGYTMTAHLPAAVLAGFDPSEHRRIGFYYMLEDRDHGQQFLTAGDDLNWWIDPSTWPTAVLAD